MHWTRLFTRKLNDKVKLVGPTISCEDPPHISANSTVPFVQFSAMATDRVSANAVGHQYRPCLVNPFCLLCLTD